MLSRLPPRLFLMALAGLLLLAALWAGLVRLGWNLPQLASSLPFSHGALMVVGFLGTVIGLERAVALRRWWAYGAPLFAATAGLCVLFGLPIHLGHLFAVLGSLFLVAIFSFLFRGQREVYLLIIGLGALLWFFGNLLWHLGYPLYRIVPWWIGFLVLTIAGERLELSRLLRLSSWDRLKFFLASGLFLCGLVVSLWTFNRGILLGGLGLIALSFWLLRYDIAWRTVHHTGLPRFMAVCLSTGYLWLMLGGFLWVAFSDLFTAGPHYDAMLHVIFLGFIFSMIFAHAPIIFPSVMEVSMPFQQAFYFHLALLNLSLLLRIGGDLATSVPVQKWGGMLNVLAVLFFLANNVRAVRLGQSCFSGKPE